MMAGGVIWLLIESVLYWCLLFYLIRSGMFFYKNKQALKSLQLKKYFLIAAGIGVLFVLLNYGAALWS